MHQIENKINLTINSLQILEYLIELTLWAWVLHEMPEVTRTFKQFLVVYGIVGLDTMFARAWHWPLSIPRQSCKIRPMLPFDPRLVFPVMYNLLVFLPVKYAHSCPPPCVLGALSIPSHWLDHCIYIWRGGKVIKLVIMYFCPTSCHFIYLASKYYF